MPAETGSILADVLKIGLGAAISTAVAIYLQARNFDQVKRQRDEDRLLDQQAQAQSIFIKLESLHRDIHAMLRYVEKAFADAKTYGGDLGEVWQTLQPIANLPPLATFEASELTVFFAYRAKELFTQVVLIPAEARLIFDAFASATEHRAAILEKFTPMQTTGKVVSGFTHVDPATRLKMNTVNDGAEELRSIAEEAEAKAFKALENVAAFMRDKLSLKISVARRDFGAPEGTTNIRS